MSNGGFVEGTLIKTPGGFMAIEDLKPGSTIIGFQLPSLAERDQIVTEVRLYSVDSITDLGCTEKQLIWMNEDFKEAERHFASEVETVTVVELVCEPDHTFKLFSGLKAHNGGGGTESLTESGTIDQTTTGTREPTPLFGGFLEDLIGRGTQAFDARNLDPLSGKAAAKINRNQREALQLQAQLGRNLFGQLGGAKGFTLGGGGGGPSVSDFGKGQLRDFASMLLRGDQLDLSTNKPLQDVIGNINLRAGQQAQRALASNASQAIAQGAFGGSGNALERARVNQDIAQQAVETTGNLSLASLEAALNRQMQAGGIFGQAQGLESTAAANARANAAAGRAASNQRLSQALQAIGLIGGAGSERQRLRQEQLNLGQQRQLINRQLGDPFQGFQNLLGLGSLGTGFGTTTSQTMGTTTGQRDVPTQGLFGQIFGGAAGIGGLLAALGKTGMFGAPGVALGAGSELFKGAEASGAF